MSVRNLVDQIIDVLEVSSRPLSGADIRRRLTGDLSPDDVSSRLAKLKKRGQVITGRVSSPAITGPRLITVYALPGTPAARHLEHVPNIAKTPEKGEISSGVVASDSGAVTQAA